VAQRRGVVWLDDGMICIVTSAGLIVCVNYLWLAVLNLISYFNVLKSFEIFLWKQSVKIFLSTNYFYSKLC